MPSKGKKAKKRLDRRIADFDNTLRGKQGYKRPGSLKK